MARYQQDLRPVIADVLATWLVTAGHTRKLFPQRKALTLNIAARVFMGMALGREAFRMPYPLVPMVKPRDGQPIRLQAILSQAR